MNHIRGVSKWCGLVALVSLAGWACSRGQLEAQDAKVPRDFRWVTDRPLVLPRDVGGISCYSIKDPSVVRFEKRWHLFATMRGKERSHAIVYMNFADWSEAERAERRVLTMHEGFFCAPQVFYFAAHRRWYLICQAASDAWQPAYQPAFATTERLDDPASWSPLQPLFDQPPERTGAWLDFWVIADATKAHLFFTSLDGRMWRAETTRAHFPHGWSEPVIALQGDVFEASHTYRLRGRDEYLTLIEAQNGRGWRYYKAYVANQLEGPWQPLAASKDQAFASLGNVQQTEHWTEAVSHGELLRAGYDERLEVEPDSWKFLIQGVLDQDREGKPYGEIPWRLGMLELKEPRP